MMIECFLVQSDFMIAFPFCLSSEVISVEWCLRHTSILCHDKYDVDFCEMHFYYLRLCCCCFWILAYGIFIQLKRNCVSNNQIFFQLLKYSILCFCNSAISDTCLAMEEWVENPHAASALSSILPCVDQRTTNNTLVQSKEVITDIVNVVNTYIYTFANANPSQTEFNYYNQSGPSMPPLCYPFDSLYQDRQCEPREVSMANASVVCLSSLSTS